MGAEFPETRRRVLDALLNAMDDEDDARLAGISPQELERRSDRTAGVRRVVRRATSALCLSAEARCSPNETATHMTCNACGFRRTDAAFYASLTGEEAH